MALPDPEPGLVVSYAYLWQPEYEAGRKEGVKDRPCAIAILMRDVNGVSLNLRVAAKADCLPMVGKAPVMRT